MSDAGRGASLPANHPVRVGVERTCVDDRPFGVIWEAVGARHMPPAIGSLSSNGERSAAKGASMPSATRVAGHPLAHAPCLPDARLPRLSAAKNGTRVPTRQPRGLAAPGGLRQPPREPCGLSGTSRSRGLPFGTRVRRFWARPALRDPPLPCRSTRQDRRGTPYSPVETVATHDIAAARTTAVGRQGLLDVHPRRASFQAPAAATSGVGSKRPVRAAARASWHTPNPRG